MYSHSTSTAVYIIRYTHMRATTNQGHRLFERNHAPFQYPSGLLCI